MLEGEGLGLVGANFSVSESFVLVIGHVGQAQRFCKPPRRQVLFSSLPLTVGLVAQ